MFVLIRFHLYKNSPFNIVYVAETQSFRKQIKTGHSPAYKSKSLCVSFMSIFVPFDVSFLKK